MCSACAIIRPRSSKSAVEQSRRSLMLAEKAERIEHRAHLLRDRAQERCRGPGARSSRSASVQQPLRPSLTPTHPGGASRLRRPARRTSGPRPSAAPVARQLEARGLAGSSAVRTATSSISRVRSGEAVPLLVRAVERLREIAPAAAPSARTTGPRSADRPRPRPAARPPRRADTRYERTASRRSSRRDEPERRQNAGAASGRAPSSIPSSSASSHACSGPAPPNATSANPARVVPRSTETTRSARSISALTTATTAAGSMPAERPLGCRAVELDPAREPLRQPSEHEVRVGHRRPRPAAPVTRGPRIRARALRARRAARRPRRARRSSRRPRRPSGCRRSAAGPGTRRPTARSRALPRRPRSGRRPSTSRPCRTRSRPRSRRRAAIAAPTTPAAGPETSANAGCAAASASVATPPDERMTSGSGKPASAQRRR